MSWTESSLALDSPRPTDARIVGDRAPDAPLRGRAGQPTRLFEIFKGPHWTLLGHDVDRDLVRPRAGLHLHTFGAQGDLVDAGEHVRSAYGLSPGDWLLERYLDGVGLSARCRPSTHEHG